MKIVVFGGCGFIGTNVCLEAKKRGYEVIAFDSLIRKDSEENIPVLTKAGVEIIRGDVRNAEDFERLPNNIGGIINFAANPGIPWSLEFPIYDFRTNTVGALNILEYSKHHGKIPVIFASTNKVYSEALNLQPLIENLSGIKYIYDPEADFMYGLSLKGVNEDFPMDSVGHYPHSPYGVSKASADLYHQEYFHAFGVPVVINRMSCIYGLYQKGVADQGWASHFVRNLIKGNGVIDIFGDGKQVRDMLWGGDVAKLYLNELEQIDNVKGEIFNVGGGYRNTCSLLEAIAIIENCYGKKFQLRYFDWRHADQKIYISDISKVTSNEFLKWKPTINPETGLKKIVEEVMGYGN